MKYVVAYSIPKNIRSALETSYKKVTGRNFPANNLHISLIYPFFIHETHSEEWVLGKLNEFHFESINSRISKIDVFEQNKKLLYVTVEPFEHYYASHLTINKILRPGIQIDTKPFISGVLPEYKPHIGIDYDFDGDYLTLESLRLENTEGSFYSGLPRLYKFDKNKFIEVS